MEVFSPLEKVETSAAPAAIGPYSQAIVCGGFLFTSGQIPIDPTTGELRDGGVMEQTYRVIDNLEAVLAAYNIGLDRIVKTTVYLKDLSHFDEMNAVYEARFRSEPRPARETIQAAGLPMDAMVEISCVAYTGE